MTSGPKRTKVFISYSHNDEKWLRRLQVHLKPLERQGLIECWDDTRLTVGQKWKAEIRRAIDSAVVAVLLISADFLASDFVDKDELPPLLRASEKEGVVILPLILKPCRFMKIESISQFQAVNPPSKPLIGMEEVEQELLFDKIADRILEVCAQQSKAQNENLTNIEEENVIENVFHPAGTESSRGELHDCRFYISPFYHKKKLWKQLADVLVEVHNSPKAEDVYLIPSGFANPNLRHSRQLRENNKEWLEKKRQVTIRFIEEWKNREIQGKWFIMQTRNGERLKVYSLAYDKFLNASLNSARPYSES